MKVNLNNDRARRDWLEQYHAWGVWFRVAQTEGALLGEIHGLRGEMEIRYPDCEAEA